MGSWQEAEWGCPVGEGRLWGCDAATERKSLGRSLGAGRGGVKGGGGRPGGVSAPRGARSARLFLAPNWSH